MKTKAIEIARALNLSKATVSLALNNKPGVSEQTRQQIFNYMDSLNERNDAPVKKSIKLVNYNKLNQQLVHTNALLMSTIKGIESVAKANSFPVEIIYFSPDTDSSRDLLANCNAENTAGIILMATDMKESDFDNFRKIRRPMIIYDNFFHSLTIDQVTINNDLAVYYALRHCIDCGHRKIMYLSRNNPIFNMAERSHAARKYQEYFSQSVDKIECFAAGTTIEDISSNVVTLLSKEPQAATVFVCESYLVTMGFLNALSELHLHVPDDYSVISIDSTDLYMIPGLGCGLTYIEIPHETRGILTMRKLIERIEHPEMAFSHIEVSPRLIIRDSVKKL